MEWMWGSRPATRLVEQIAHQRVDQAGRPHLRDAEGIAQGLAAGGVEPLVNAEIHVVLCAHLCTPQDTARKTPAVNEARATE
jgi:hypothetical protein